MEHESATVCVIVFKSLIIWSGSVQYYCCKLCRLPTRQFHSEAKLCCRLMWWYMEVHLTDSPRLLSILMARQWYQLRTYQMLCVYCISHTMCCGWNIQSLHIVATNIWSRRYSNRKRESCHQSCCVCCLHARSNLVWIVAQSRRWFCLSQCKSSNSIGSRPSDCSVCWFVCLSVCLCRVFLSRLWSDFDQTRTYVICLGLVVSPRI